MKRSEMISYLHNLLQTYSENTKLERAQVDEILEGLEHMGMQPPLIETEEVIDSEEYVAFKYAWEPE